MKRKNIFDILKNKFDLEEELYKVYKYFCEVKMTECGNTKYSIEQIIDLFYFHDWKYSGVCENVKEFFQRADADLFDGFSKDFSQERVINFLEATINFVKLFDSKLDEIYEKHHFKYYTDYYDFLWKVMNEILSGLNLKSYKVKDKHLIRPKNEVIQQVLDEISKDDLKWELLDFIGEKLKNNLKEKRKLLAYFATELYIEKDNEITYEPLKQVIGECTCILNNLHIRHNNKTGKWANDVLSNMTNSEAIKWCDRAYDKILTIIMLRKQAEYNSEYKKFTVALKGGKTNEQ